MEGSRIGVQYRITDSCCPEVWFYLLKCCPSQLKEHSSHSGSMEPAFYRGDLLFLTNPASERYHTGDITVYKIPGADIPIVHRVMETHDTVSKDKG